MLDNYIISVYKNIDVISPKKRHYLNEIIKQNANIISSYNYSHTFGIPYNPSYSYQDGGANDANDVTTEIKQTAENIIQNMNEISKNMNSHVGTDISKEIEEKFKICSQNMMILNHLIKYLTKLSENLKDTEIETMKKQFEEIKEILNRNLEDVQN